MENFVVYREVVATYATIVQAESEEQAYEIIDNENYKTDSENPDVKWIKVNRIESIPDSEAEKFSSKNQLHLTIDSKIKGIPVKNIDISEFTFEDIMSLSQLRTLEPEEFEFFKPIQPNEDTFHFESLKEVEDYLLENNLNYGEERYRHIWTMVDGDNDSVVLINGFHFVNRLGYVLCQIPWGYDNSQETNKNIYIEATW